jgi:hypothetical protein
MKYLFLVKTIRLLPDASLRFHRISQGKAWGI